MRLNKTLIVTIWAVWLAFNLAVAGTVVYFFVSHRVVFTDVKHEELQGNFQEMKAFRPEIHNKYRNKVRTLNEENRKLRVNFLEELVKAEPDYDALKILSDKIQDTTQEISVNFFKEMIEMRKNLSLDEAKEFYGHQLNMLKRRSGPPAEMDAMGPPPMDAQERGPRDWEQQETRHKRFKAKKSE
jgi:hypothetical protein